MRDDWQWNRGLVWALPLWLVACSSATSAGGNGAAGSATDAAVSADADVVDAAGDSAARANGDAGAPRQTDAGAQPTPAQDDGLVLVNPSIYNTLIGRPTDRSIAISVMVAKAGDKAWVEYGAALTPDKQGIAASSASPAVTSTAGEPVTLEIGGLVADSKYYYRVHYQAGGQGDAPDNIHSFRTQRAKGRTFHFGVQGDTHPERYNNKMFHPELFKLTMEQVRLRQPDLYFTLGDDFSIEKIIENFKAANYPSGHKFSKGVEGKLPPTQYAALPKPFDQAMLVDGSGAPKGYAAYRELREQYFGLMGAATVLMLTNGNHEQAHLANLGGIFNNAAIWAADGRLKYYPQPAPDAFYSGDALKLAARNGYPTLAAPDGLLRDYYAFTWGDALFVTLDPYWHSEEVSPDSTLYDDPEPKWGATLGDVQYQWLKQTLETSTAKWKFVFAHHVNGNNRGAAAIVGSQEWGGEPGFAENRKGWAKPIHQLFADTKVTIFFQGHDHMYARERVDGVVYQEVPNPADNSYFAYNCDAYAPASIKWLGPAGYGKYEPDYSVRLPDTGFLDVTVSPDSVRVEYVRTYRAIDLQTNPNGQFSGKEQNGEVAFRYTIPPHPSDTLPKDVPFKCLGAAPPKDWKFNP